MAHDRRIRLALQLTHAPSGEAWAELARRSEDQGYDTISLPDHLGEMFAPMPALAAVAAATSRVTLSMFVLANDWRHPAMLAKEVATLELLSGGRVELGLGAGWDQSEYRAMGIPFDRPGVRIGRLDEAVTILRGLLAGESVSFEGRHYRTHELVALPRPVRPGGVPLVLGGGARRMLSLAAARADIVSIATDNSRRDSLQGHAGKPIRFDDVRRQVGWVREAAAERFGDLELNLRVLGTAVDPDRRAAAARIAEQVGADPDDVLDSPFMFAGTVTEIVDHACRVRDELGISYFTVSQRYADQLAPVVEALAGR